MAERPGPAVFTIPVHRSFADALVNGLIALHGRDRMELARGIVLVPNNRAVRAITDAFVRRAEHGLLLPRFVAVGDVGDEALGALFDGGAEPLPPAVDPLHRRFILARLIQEERALIGARVDAAEAMRLATALTSTLDQLLAEEIAPATLREVQVKAELSAHWQKSLDLFAVLIARWPEELARIGRIDLVERRNILLQRAAAKWAEAAPAGFVVAAGVTTSAKAVAALMRTVARMPRGMVVLPGVDLASPDDEWEAIATKAIESHPQHHLRMLLDRIDVARSDVKRWRWGDGRARLAVRARAVSNAFAPAEFTAKWNTLPPGQVRLEAIRGAVFATPAEEAQGIAIALREALETSGETAALVTPDRVLAERVVGHLKRWEIDADDSAGKPLSETPSGTLILAATTAAVERFAPVALLALVKHPLVRSGETRADWLDGSRALDIALRGPRPAPGLAGLAAFLRTGDERTRSARARAENWWQDVAPVFEPLEAAFADPHPSFADLIEAVRATVATLAGDAAWSGPAGRAAAELFDALAANCVNGPRDFDADALVPLLRQLLGEVAVRPPQGGHPRISIWGLLEARLQQADLLVLGGLNEGVWPASPAPDPWLAPRVRMELGLGGIERRVGLSAHDLATALGGREVLMTRARRDARAPTIASRFWLRLTAMTGALVNDERLVRVGQGIDAAIRVPSAARPAPAPPAALRPRRISVTEVDRLKADPYAFYAKAMLKLPSLDGIDADPGPAWRGTAVHAVLEAWAKDDGFDPARLRDRVRDLMAQAGTHPLLRALWEPRLSAAIDWIAVQIGEDRAQGRTVLNSEIRGKTDVAGITLHGIADRIDRIDGALAIVDYKTGKAPSAAAVEAGYSMQLGLLGLIAERGGFDGIAGQAGVFEYWSLASDGKGGFGKRTSPVGGKSSLTRDNFVAASLHQFEVAAAKWLTGADPFTAKLVPEYAIYEDYDHLMRRDEWYGREE